MVFRDVVGAADPDHFRQEDREMLALYRVHVIAARKLMKRKRREPDLHELTSRVLQRQMLTCNWPIVGSQAAPNESSEPTRCSNDVSSGGVSTTASLGGRSGTFESGFG